MAAPGFSKQGLTRHIEVMVKRYPVAGGHISNFVELRNLKLRSLRKLQQLAPNMSYMRYENLRGDPAAMVAQLRDRMGLPRVEELTPVKKDVSRPLRRLQFVQRTKDPLPDVSTEDRQFILGGLDLVQEAGYSYSYDAEG